MNSALQLRKFVSADGDSCHQLFCDTVRRVNCRDYSTVQVDAWAGAGLDTETWVRRFDGNFAYVVERDGAIVSNVLDQRIARTKFAQNLTSKLGTPLNAVMELRIADVVQQSRQLDNAQVTARISLNRPSRRQHP